jgi:hypothetical protein
MRNDNSSASRPAADARPPRTRSAVTNGHRLHVRPVGDSAWSRRFKDLVAEITSDLGGADCLSEGQRQLARRCATIALECEKIEVRAVSGQQIDLETYGQLTDRLGRAFARLGLKRVVRDVTPSLAEYLAARTTEPVEDVLDDDPAPDAPDDEEPAGGLPNTSAEAPP